ncbi:MAG TPA: DUF4236 domain-containing protein [Hyphomicrobiaceae bacterium]|nr:DUF4236 domain-containing protein [Hyphomicrobiaceae bacterium]
MRGARAMGYFRFRKSISVLPGVKVNLSKTGVSTSVGGKGATLNIGHGKKNVTLGIPGTGLSYRTQASSQLMIAAVVVVILVGIAYLIQPELVKAALHWWQPRWF